MFKKSQHGWRLLKQSSTIFKKYPKLIVLPTIGRGFFLLLVIGISILGWAIKKGHIDWQKVTTGQAILIYAALLFILFWGNVITAFFDAVLMICLKDYQQNRELSLTASFKQAGHLFRKILYWTFIQLTIGKILPFFHDKLMQKPYFRQLLSGLQWRYATYIVFPLLIEKSASPLAAIRDSSQIMQPLLQERPLVHNFSYFWVSVLIRLIILLPSLSFTLAGSIITIFGLTVISIAQHGLMIVLQYALYYYITTHQICKDFNPDDISTALAA